MSEGVAAPTERLYYRDATLREFSAVVVDRSDGGLRVYLDRTAFYPTSGGQPHDRGTLGTASVIDVIDEGDRIAHLLDTPLGSGEVSGRIDWQRRFDHMQQHTGQHLLSAVFDDLLGAKTVSVHFGQDSSTLDIAAPTLSPDDLDRVERRANTLVLDALPVSVSFEDAGSASGLRKAVERSGELRIVTIAGVDRSACGGTHVSSTAEIGQVLLRGTERMKQGTRVEFVCGLRALDRAREDHRILSALAASLSCSIGDLPSIVSGQAEQLKSAAKMRKELGEQLAALRVESLFSRIGESAPRIVTHAAPMADLRVMAQAVTRMDGAVFIGTADDGPGIVVAASADSGIDASGLLSPALKAVGGRGGGSPRIAQGAAPSIDELPRLTTLVSQAVTEAIPSA